MGNKFFTSKIFYILTSIFFAIVLFFNASAIAIRNDGVSNNGEIYTATVENVPIELKYDTSKYFASSTVTSTTVHLSGYNRLQVLNEENPDTRNFYLSIDLTNVSVGTKLIPIRVEQLSTGVNAQLEPASASITLEPKVVQEFEVTPKVEPAQIPSGFKVNSMDLSDTTVQVTAGKESIKKIKTIEADLPSAVMLTDDFSGIVALRAVDANGKTLPAQISPNTTRMKVSVEKLSKEVPVKVKITGTLDSSLSSMKTSLSQDTVQILGEQAALDKINNIEVEADVSGVTQGKQIKVNLQAADVTVHPQTITVTLTPVKK